MDEEYSRLAAAARKDIEDRPKVVPSSAKTLEEMKAELTQMLAKQFPGKCFELLGALRCRLVPGMPIAIASVVFDLRSTGYSETASGRDDRYEYGKCRVYARDEKVTAVFC